MTLHHLYLRRGVLLVSLGLWAVARAQSPVPPDPHTPAAQQPTSTQARPAETPHGKVLYQSHGEATAEQRRAPPTNANPQTEASDGPQLTDADREAVAISSYDLDIRLTPGNGGLTGRARLQLTNTSDTPLPRIALQISSSLIWQSAAVQGTGGRPSVPLLLAQHRLDTDADHTGKASEAILTLPTPVAPGASIALDLFYSGSVQASGGRLERLGARLELAQATDWDAVTPEGTALRGFGNVLWFPVAAPQLFLSDGTLVPAIGRARLKHAATSVRLRLRVDYAGEAPTAAYFCGRREPLHTVQDDSAAPVAYGSGVAIADFAAEPIGVRPLSLFVLDSPERLIAPLPAPAMGARKASGTLTDIAPGEAPNADSAPMLAVETTDDKALPLLAASAERVAPLLQEWLGPRPLSALTVIDHSGQPFEDGPLLVAPVGTLAASTAAPALMHSLTHAWMQTGQPWMDEGLGEFFSLLWTEREQGRDAAVAQLDALMQPVIQEDNVTEDSSPAAPEAGPASSSTAQVAEFGQPLIAAYDEAFLRRKAAAVWWMLRDVAGEQPLEAALSAWRTQRPRDDSPEAQAHAFETLLEKTSGKDLGWFFNDWVLHDRGLPALSLVDVTPRLLPAGAGHDTGWLVAVTMHNAGAAAAEVPLVIRSGTFSTTKRVRIPGGSNVTERVVVEAVPTEVVLNDGSTPESGPLTHTRTVVTHSE